MDNWWEVESGRQNGVGLWVNRDPSVGRREKAGYWEENESPPAKVFFFLSLAKVGNWER